MIASVETSLLTTLTYTDYSCRAYDCQLLLSTLAQALRFDIHWQMRGIFPSFSLLLSYSKAALRRC